MTSNVIVDASDVIALLKRIEETHPNNTFETYAEIVDKVASLGYDNVPEHNMLNTLLVVLFGWYSVKVGPEWRDVPFLYREIIIQSILELEREQKIADYDIYISYLHDFIEWVAATDKKTSLVSLNYDNVLFESIKGLGFNHCFDYVPQAGNMDFFDYELFHRSEKVVYFPHGHSRFKRTNYDTIQYFENPRKAEESRWAGLRDNTPYSSLTLNNNNAFAYDFNSFITTGQTKDSSLNMAPYDAYYQRLSRDILDSEFVYVVGYSFGDEHINRLLHSYLYTNPLGRILIVDKTDGIINLANDIIKNKGIVRKLYDTFKPVVFFPKIADISSYESQGIWEINNYGYGQLVSRISFYRKGVLEFLKEYKDLSF